MDSTGCIKTRFQVPVKVDHLYLDVKLISVQFTIPDTEKLMIDSL